MSVPLRAFENFIATRPQDGTFQIREYRETPSADFIWFRLRELAEAPSAGKALFSGTRAEINAKFRDFQAFVRQARTYWNAAEKTDGAAAALPYYYSLLQLAKAELLISHPASVQGGAQIRHGLSWKPSRSEGIRGDALVTTDGVFRLLSEKRTGVATPNGLRLKAMNLLSLIPEIGLEMTVLGVTRPRTAVGYYALAMTSTEAWSLVLTLSDVLEDPREPLAKHFGRGYEEVTQADFPRWRNVFGISTRMFGGGVHLYQAKKTKSLRDPSGTQRPDTNGAIEQLIEVVGPFTYGPDTQAHDFYLSHSLTKTTTRHLPLGLTRYAALYYLSSLVRYRPVALDPFAHGDQAYVMDSFVNEVPTRLLIDSLDGIAGTRSHFDPRALRL